MSNVILTNTIKSEPWIHTITLLLNTREKKRRNNKLLHFQLKKSVHKSMKNINTIFLVFLFPRIVIINLYISFYVPEIQIWWIREATKKHINNKIHWNIEWTKSRKKNQKKKVFSELPFRFLWIDCQFIWIWQVLTSLHSIELISIYDLSFGSNEYPKSKKHTKQNLFYPFHEMLI